jgi:putative nucleotidyltransferase with HDIG domain
MVDSPLFGRLNNLYASVERSLPRSGSTINPLDHETSGINNPYKAIEDLQFQLDQKNKENLHLKSSNEFGITLANVSDKNLAIHQAALKLQYSLKCGLVAYFTHAVKDQRLELFFPFGPETSRLRDKLGERWERYWHSLTGGLIGRAVRSGKIQVSNETDPTLELLYAGTHPFLSLIAAPIHSRGYLEGVILLADTRQNYFDPIDIRFTNDICTQFNATLDRISYSEHDQMVIQATNRMVDIRNPRVILQQLAQLTLETTGARMAIAAIFDESDWCIETAGQVDQRLMNDINGLSSFFHFITSQSGLFLLQDYRSNDFSLMLDIEDQTLRAMLACPFTLSDFVSAQDGILVALGKTAGAYFTSVDETLIQHLANNAALAMDYALTKNDLRANADRHQRALNLSLDIARSNKLDEASLRILADVKNQFGAETAGLVLVDEMDDILIQISLPDEHLSDGLDNMDLVRVNHPMEKIRETIHTGEQQVLPSGDMLKKIYPIKTQDRCYGAMWLELPIRGGMKTNRDEDVRALINQTAVALESSIRNARIHSAYQELNRAYSALTDSHTKLEQSHNQLAENFIETIRSLVSALEEREKETAQHTIRMERIALGIGQELHLNRDEMHNLRYGTILHDIGKIGVPDAILLKEGSLTRAERIKIEEHALKGARIVQNIPGLEGAVEVIANHHESWNGSGYPYGLEGRMIPLLARIVTVADVYDALTHDRPYRKKMPVDEVIDYMKHQAGILFDPDLVDILIRILPIQPGVDAFTPVKEFELDEVKKLEAA